MTTSKIALTIFFFSISIMLTAQTKIEPTQGCINCDIIEPSAVFEIESTDRGFLTPRMTDAERGAIVSPANGLMVFNITTGTFWYYTTSIGWGELKGGTHSIGTNTKTGTSTLQSLSTGYSNTGNGVEVLPFNNTGYENSAYGYNAMFNNLSGSKNTAMGVLALQGNSTGGANTAIGTRSLFSNVDRSNLVAIGDSALYHNGVGASFILHSLDNTAVGSNALYSNTIGSYNTSVGYDALRNSISGDGNTANGYQALYNNTYGTVNSVNGYQAMYFNTTGGFNTAMGYRASYLNISGADNTSLGHNSFYENISGDKNTAIGSFALHNSSSADFVTGVGFSANYFGANYSNSSGFGNQANATAINEVVIGNSSVNSIGGYANWTNISDRRFKKNISEKVKGLDFILKLRPVTYQLNQKAIEQFFVEKYGFIDSTNWEGKYDKSSIIQTGFLAQEVEAAAQTLNYDFSGVDKPKNDKDFYGLRYAEFTVPLVKAVQEMNATDEELKIENELLKTQVEKNSEENILLRNELEDLKKMIAQLQGCCVAKEESKNSSIQIELGASQNEDIPYLEQNAPNPFYDETFIKYYLPKNFESATMRFTDWQGQNLKTIQLQDVGEGTISISAKELAAGTYAYTLVVDGQLIDTKKMILTK